MPHSASRLKLRSWCTAAVLGTAVATAATPARALPTFAQVRMETTGSESTLLDRHGVALETMRTDATVRRLPWVPLAEISPTVKAALVLTEDKRFYEHAGIDWSAAGAAAWNNLTGAHVRGASTLTMQLAGLLDQSLQSKNGRSIGQKLDQAAIAVALDHAWKKDEILEAYLNLVSFRGELSGIGALSGALFEKLPSGLNTREAAIAVALIRSPNAPAARVTERACAILKEQHQAGLCGGLGDYAASMLTRRLVPAALEGPRLAPHLAHRLLKAGPGASIETTLDASLQRFANQALRQQLAELQGRNVEDGAIVVLDNATGDVLAYVGSSGDYSMASSVDNVVAPRQAGSTLKPFLYELALERRWLTAASLLDDSPVDLKTAAGLYIPQNYDHDFKGMVSLRTALGSSLNVPAVRTIVLVTPDAFHQRLRNLGFALRETGDYYGYSLALGSSEVSLMNLANAYRTIANRGRSSPPRVLANAPVEPAHVVLDAAASFIVADILADRNARAVTFGLGNVLDTRYWSAVKTGTSKDMRDNWCVGFSARYTVAVWVGNDSGQSMWDVSGVSGAAPVWHAVMDYLHARDRQSGAVAATPPGVALRQISFADGLEPDRQEWFLNGTEVSRVEPAQLRRSSEHLIAQPVAGTIVALDPDIPLAAQKLRLRAVTGAATSVRWRMDGIIAGTTATSDWPLWPGHHHLELIDAGDHVLDSLDFEVRGAQIKSARAG